MIINMIIDMIVIVKVQFRSPKLYKKERPLFQK